MLAEDDTELVEYLQRKLKSSGYVVERVDNGVDAEFLALEENFDGIILDLGLPQKSGIEVLQNWRQRKLDTPVLILTARDSWQERQAVSIRGVTGATRSNITPQFRPCRQSPACR